MRWMSWHGVLGSSRNQAIKEIDSDPALDKTWPVKWNHRIRQTVLKKRRSGAFTLLEMLVVIVVIGILAALLLPALSKAKQKGQGVECLSNLRQLQLAWTMYAQEHEDALAPNSDGPRAGRELERPAWVAGWLRTDLQNASKYDSTNIDLLVGKEYAQYGSIGSYAQNPKIYRCPGDQSIVTIDEVKYPRVRSMSMNAYLSGKGAWNSPEYVTFHKFAEIPRPSETWVLVDEREDSINDGYFATDPTRSYAIVDYPASYHNGSCGFSFADGHSEYHKWLEPTTTPVLQPGQHLTLGSKYTSWNDRDMAWLIERTTVKKASP